MEESDIILKLSSSQWMDKEADRILTLYKKAKTNREKVRLMSQLEALKGKIQSNLRELDTLHNELFGEEDYNRGF